MSTVIVVVLLMGFSFCVVVGLLAVLQNLINGHPFDGPSQAPLLPDRSEQ
jgi:hypothetical protein